MSEVQPETPAVAATPEKPKRKPAKAKPVEAQPEVVVTVSGNALATEAEIREAVESVARTPAAAPALDIAPFLAYKASHPHWGALHCVIHDGCLDDDGVARAQQDANMLRDSAAAALAGVLAGLSEAGRRSLREVLR